MMQRFETHVGLLEAKNKQLYDTLSVKEKEIVILNRKISHLIDDISTDGEWVTNMARLEQYPDNGRSLDEQIDPVWEGVANHSKSDIHSK